MMVLGPWGTDPALYSFIGRIVVFIALTTNESNATVYYSSNHPEQEMEIAG